MGPPHPLASRQSRLSCSSSATHTNSSDSRRAPHRKENQFVYQNGSKLHAYGRDKAPYPFSFDPDVVELQCLDHALMSATIGSPSFADLDPASPPKRCLDIGTGLGVWVVSAAKHWPEATFVGLDMVNIQIPHQALDTTVADRIEWVHTNILRNKLPFEDDEFDYVHVQGVALGVPENKWNGLYEEIRRVAAPGALIEHVEEDAIFPTLPRWYTDVLRMHSRGLSTATPGSVQQRLSMPCAPDTSHLTHEHELLETLFTDVWYNRFINPTPTSIVPAYFGSYFERVQSPPVALWATPPFAPFAPLPGAPSDFHSPLAHHSFSPPANVNGNGNLNGNGNGYYTVSSARPSFSPNADGLGDHVLAPSPSTTLQDPVEAKHSVSPSPSLSSLQEEVANVVSFTRKNDLDNASTVSLKSGVGSTSSGTGSGTGSGSGKSGRRPSALLLAAPDEGTSLGGEGAAGLLPKEKVQAQGEAKSMQLYYAVRRVLATKEAMWEELLARVLARDERLARYGWREEDYGEQASRARFEYACELYQSDMRGRIALWHCAVQNGWELPARDPPTKAEVTEEMHLRQELVEAQRLAEDEPEPPCRKFRILIGYTET